MLYQQLLRDKINEAANGDPEAEVFLRNIVRRAADSAPRHSLVKIARFFCEEIYPDADRDAALVN